MTSTQRDIYVVLSYKGNCIKGRLYLGLSKHDTAEEAISSCDEYHKMGRKSIVARMPLIEFDRIKLVIMRERGVGKTMMVLATRPYKLAIGVWALYKVKGNRLVRIRRFFKMPYNIQMYGQAILLSHYLPKNLRAREKKIEDVLDYIRARGARK